MKIILASLSPRRRELLMALGHDIHVIPSSVEEITELPSHDPINLALINARLKARAVFEAFGHMNRDVIVGADTIVASDNEIFFKPIDRADASRILEKLSGTLHEVITGYCIINASGDEISRHVSSGVEMRTLSKKEIDAYLDTNEWIGKSGAFSAQGFGSALIRQIHGSITNVVGLPIEEFLNDATTLIDRRQ